MKGLRSEAAVVAEASLRDLLATISTHILRPLSPEPPARQTHGVVARPASEPESDVPKRSIQGETFAEQVFRDRPEVSLPLVTSDVPCSAETGSVACGTHIDAASFAAHNSATVSVVLNESCDLTSVSLVKPPVINNWPLVSEWAQSVYRNGFRIAMAVRASRRRQGHVPFNLNVHRMYAGLPDDFSPASQVDEPVVAHKQLLLNAMRRRCVMAPGIGPDTPQHIEFALRFLTDASIWSVEGDEIFQLLLGSNSETVATEDQWHALNPCNSIVHRKLRSLFFPFLHDNEVAKNFAVSIVLRRDCYPCLLISNMLKSLRQANVRSTETAAPRHLHDHSWHTSSNTEQYLRSPLQVHMCRHTVNYIRNVVKNAGPITAKDSVEFGAAKDGVLRLTTKVAVVDGILPGSKSNGRLPLCPCCVRHLEESVGCARQPSLHNHRFEFLNICQLDNTYDVGDGHTGFRAPDEQHKPESYVARVQDFVTDLKRQKAEFVSDELTLAAERWFHHRVLPRLDPRIQRLVMPPNLLFCPLEGPIPLPSHTLVRPPVERPSRPTTKVFPCDLTCVKITGIRSDVSEDELLALLVAPFAYAKENVASRVQMPVPKASRVMNELPVDSHDTDHACYCPGISRLHESNEICDRCLAAPRRRLYVAPEYFSGPITAPEDPTRDALNAWKDAKITEKSCSLTTHAMRGYSTAWAPDNFLRTVVKTSVDDVTAGRGKGKTKKGKLSYLSAGRGKDDCVVWINSDVSSRKEPDVCPFSGLRTGHREEDESVNYDVYGHLRHSNSLWLPGACPEGSSLASNADGRVFLLQHCEAALLQGVDGKAARLLQGDPGLAVPQVFRWEAQAICNSVKVDEQRQPGLSVVVHVLVDSVNEARRLQRAVREAASRDKSRRALPEPTVRNLVDGAREDRIRSLASLFRQGREVTVSNGFIEHAGRNR